MSVTILSFNPKTVEIVTEKTSYSNCPEFNQQNPWVLNYLQTMAMRFCSGIEQDICLKNLWVTYKGHGYAIPGLRIWQAFLSCCRFSWLVVCVIAESSIFATNVYVLFTTAL